jgi:hypothetical protein
MHDAWADVRRLAERAKKRAELLLSERESMYRVVRGVARPTACGRERGLPAARERSMYPSVDVRATAASFA